MCPRRVYFGSTEPFIYRERVFGIDTGCCTGGALTGLLLPEFRILTVHAPVHYWQVIRRTRYAQRLADMPVRALRWEEIERWREKAAQQSTPTPETAQRLADLAQLVSQAEALLPRILAHVEQEHTRQPFDKLKASLAALRRAHTDYDTLPPREQGKLYAAHIGKTPLVRLLH